MKTTSFKSSLLAVAAVAALALVSGNATAQDAAAPQLSYGLEQILKLEQAKVGDSVIVNYVQNSGISYSLKADEIVYLKQQGVSDNVLNAMLNQRSRLTGSGEPVATTSATATPPATSSAVNSAQSSSPAAPSVTYIQQQPAQPSTVYVVPTTQTYSPAPYYYPYYGGYGSWPAISLSFAWGSSGGSSYHGGYYGGWHGGGWHH